jgi:putative peptidoglycan lipid II flippase
MGILHTRGRFFLPAVAPICLSGSQIFFILVLGVYFEPDPIYALAWGVLIGGALQFLVQVPALVKEGYAIRLEWDPGLSDIRRIGVLFVPVVIALGVNQINSLVDTFLSSFLEQGSLAALNFAARLYTFPLGLFGASVAMVALPSLSRTNADHDLSTSNHLAEVVQWWQRTLFYLLPATVFLIAFPNEVVALIYQRGSFGSQAVQRVGGVLLLYAIGLPAFGSVKILASGYYSLQDTRSPMIRAVIATLTNILLSVLLMHWIGVRGIALATSVAAYLHVGLLAVGLSGKGGNRVMDRKAGMRLAIMLAACAVMLGVGLLTWRCSPAGAVAGGFIQRSLWLLLVAGMMAGTYLLVARLAGIRGR